MLVERNFVVALPELVNGDCRHSRKLNSDDCHTHETTFKSRRDKKSTIPRPIIHEIKTKTKKLFSFVNALTDIEPDPIFVTEKRTFPLFVVLKIIQKKLLVNRYELLLGMM
jgi:hypothetical protein